MARIHKRAVSRVTQRRIQRLNSRDQIFVDLVGQLGTANIPWVAQQAEVCPATVYNWLNGDTLTPRIDTLCKVAKVMGYEIVLKRVKGYKLKAVK